MRKYLSTVPMIAIVLFVLTIMVSTYDLRSETNLLKAVRISANINMLYFGAISVLIMRHGNR